MAAAITASLAPYRCRASSAVIAKPLACFPTVALARTPKQLLVVNRPAALAPP